VLNLLKDEEQIAGYSFKCPGCQMEHGVYISPYKNIHGASWLFNDNLESPTFRPSILTRVTRSDGKVIICHLLLTNGEIQFLPDSTHSLSGQTVGLN
jgi:hypothetical protein